MKQTKQIFTVTGMHCGGCAESIRLGVSKLKGVNNVKVSYEKSSLELASGKNLTTKELDVLVKKLDKKYSVSDYLETKPSVSTLADLKKYLPVLVITLISLFLGLAAKIVSNSGWDMFMHIYMGTFFAAFGSFKLASLMGFASMFRSYDLIAKIFPAWGYIFTFLELGLALLYLTGNWLMVANIVTFVVMTVASAGVLVALLKKNRVVCACLGGVFSFPISWVTFLEDFSMAVMALAMLVYMLISNDTHTHWH